MKNCIFDFGQVLVRFDPDYMTSFYIEDEADRALAREVIFDRLYWDRLDEGSITDEEVKAGIISRLPERLQAPATAAYDGWIEHLPEIEGMVALLDDLKAEGVKLYLLSNISKGFAENYKKVPAVENILSRFDGLVFSGPIGIVKPGREIFCHLLDRFGLSGEDCIFIDDNEKNIKGCAAAGIEGYLFDGDASALRKYLFSAK